jgi:hypothetical protein
MAPSAERDNMPIVNQHPRTVIPDENFLDPHTIRERKAREDHSKYVAPSTPAERDTKNAKDAAIMGERAIIAAGPRSHGHEAVARAKALLERLSK